MANRVLISLLFLTACTSAKKTTNVQPGGQLIVDGKIWAAAFHQRSAEYKALSIQAYSIATLRLDQSLSSGTNASRKKAVITDIDETFLDNSPFAVHQALLGKDYDINTWYEWTAKAISDTLAGSAQFFKYAASKNVEVFYITNRDEVERQSTLANLKRFGFPFADNEHLILREKESNKEGRRQRIMSTYDVVLLLGDNLSDFSELFERKSEEERSRNVIQSAAEFGKRFILLPNINYGGWEDAMFLNNRNWTPAQKDSLVKAGLKQF
jgi:5'-nucleotidase (lipoprotein e(P4) family)